jgi:hypothetical protein
MATTNKGRQQQLRESRATKEPVDPRSLVLNTGLGGHARPIPLRDQIMSMVRNELRDAREDHGQIGPLDWQSDEEEPEPLSIYELAVDIHDNPAEYDHLFGPAQTEGNDQTPSDEEIIEAARSRIALRDPPPPDDTPAE